MHYNSLTEYSTQTSANYLNTILRLNNFTNKSININLLCEGASIDILSLMNRIEEVRTKVKN